MTRNTYSNGWRMRRINSVVSCEPTCHSYGVRMAWLVDVYKHFTPDGVREARRSHEAQYPTLV